MGQWAEAEKVVAAALRHRPSGADAVELLLARCRLSVGYGDIEAADRDLDAVATLLAGGGARHVMPLLTLRAGLAMWQGRHDVARQAVQRGLTESRSDDVMILLGALVWHGLRAEAEAHASRTVAVDPTAVRRLRDVADRVARKSAGARPAGALGGGGLPGAVRRRGEPPRRQRPGAVGRVGGRVGPTQSPLSGGVLAAAAGRGAAGSAQPGGHRRQAAAGGVPRWRRGWARCR